MNKLTASKHKRKREQVRVQHQQLINEWKNRAFLQKIDFIRVERPIRTYKVNRQFFNDYSLLEASTYFKKDMAAELTKQLFEDNMFSFIQENDSFNNTINIQAWIDIVEPKSI